MVVKTTSCFYSERKIYPGHGFRYFRKDGKALRFGSKKAFSVYKNNTKPTKIQWTIAWRRLNKKVTTTTSTHKKRSKKTKELRAIEGVSFEDIIKKRNENKDFRKAFRIEQARKIKERNKTKMELKKKNSTAQGKKKGDKQKNKISAKSQTSRKAFNKARR